LTFFAVLLHKGFSAEVLKQNDCIIISTKCKVYLISDIKPLAKKSFWLAYVNS